MGGASTILPGFSRLFGSNKRLTLRNSWYSSGPKSFSFRWLRARPSPCSPDMAPPNSITRSEISREISVIISTSPASLRLMNGRICMQPTEQWP